MLRVDRFNDFVFNEPTKIIYGEGSIKELKNELIRLKSKAVLLVCDNGIVKAGLADEIKKVVEDTPGVKFCQFDKIMVNPTDTIMDEGYEFAKENEVDTIIGLGGGSSMDSAKGIALLMTNGGKMREYLMEGKVVDKVIAPTICIPTTAGTGSEVTRTVVATDHITKFKDGFKYADTMYAEVAILDPMLMAGLPAHVLAACGMDALTHAIEAYTTWKGNPITDALNIHAIKLIGENIRKAFSQPTNIDAKGKMLLASAITGVAFDQAGLGLAHCMGHPMGGLFNVAHGVACGMALPVVMEYNLISNPRKFAEVAAALGEDTYGLNDYEAGKMAVESVRKMLKDMNLPMTLGEVGIEEKDIPALAKDAMGFPGMRGANPRAASYKDVEDLFRKLL
ncbi:MAG TPA: iron-containing alcohol dehydrogenase [Thermoclostridium caenicola]|uniref:iron-containing alcohol dehydrogenase n=1 Tax=Thermoclostridium caenicola TaxID=659425 RepID=UPI002CED2FA1|nr:iron-containing alcohol dehydrogenase [Thermoclostridium caenicola]HPO76121.1 iron-containing alcohol dehydrogenase [Thermoclostridium caenicola]